MVRTPKIIHLLYSRPDIQKCEYLLNKCNLHFPNTSTFKRNKILFNFVLLSFFSCNITIPQYFSFCFSFVPQYFYCKCLEFNYNKRDSQHYFMGRPEHLVITYYITIRLDIQVSDLLEPYNFWATITSEISEWK